MRRRKCLSLRTEFLAAQKNPDEVIIPRKLIADIVSMICEKKKEQQALDAAAVAEYSDSDHNIDDKTALLDQSPSKREAIEIQKHDS